MVSDQPIGPIQKNLQFMEDGWNEGSGLENFENAIKSADDLRTLLSSVSYNRKKGWHLPCNDEINDPESSIGSTVQDDQRCVSRCVTFSEELKQYDADGRMSIYKRSKKRIEQRSEDDEIRVEQHFERDFQGKKMDSYTKTKELVFISESHIY